MTKVLLVEDDNNLREIFEMRLQAEGYETSVASDGEEALVVALKEKPDLVIADVMMPKMSGFEMLETLKATPEMANTKVIMMTALGQAEDRERGEKLGVIKYLVKSQVTLEDFVQTVKEVLGAGATTAGAQNSNTAGQGTQASNNKEGEKMDEGSQSSNPAPGGDSAAPANNPISGTPSGGTTGNDAMSSSQQQSTVNDQINDFVSQPAPAAPAADGMSDAPAADTPTPPPSAPPTGGDAPAGTPPADPAGGNPPAGGQSTTPGGM